MPFDPCVTRIIPELHAWQEHLHRNPELSFEEFETTAYLAELLSAMPGVSVSRPTKTGLVASIRGEKDGRQTVLAYAGISMRSPSRRRAASPMHPSAPA